MHKYTTDDYRFPTFEFSGKEFKVFYNRKENGEYSIFTFENNERCTVLQPFNHKKLTENNEGGRHSEFVTFVKNNKRFTRKVRTNKRGTEYVVFEGKNVPLSRLKVIKSL